MYGDMHESGLFFESGANINEGIKKVLYEVNIQDF